MGWNFSLISDFLILLCTVIINLWILHIGYRRSFLLDNGPLNVSRVQLVILWTFPTLCLFYNYIWTSSWRLRSAPKGVAARSQFREVNKPLGPRILLVVTVFGLLASLDTTDLRSHWGEGCVRTMAGTRVDDTSTKLHGEELLLTFGSHQPPVKRSRVVKRSYRRALHRISRHGYTWYRGRILSGPIDPSIATSSPPSFKPSHNLPAPGHKRRKRMTCFSWNAGGMSMTDWDRFQQWLPEQSLDILAIQETHWVYTTEWTQANYYCVHSGLNNKQAGVMILISKSMCNLKDISWSEIMPGRLLHVRIHGQQRAIDILNVYQYIHATHTMTDRQTLWTCLHEYLSKLPKRNGLLIMGDFNTSLQKRGPAVGLPTYQWHQARATGPKHSDANELYHLTQIYDLIALNTWKSCLGPTFQFGSQHSRIDYIFYKRHLVDASAKQVHYLHNFPLLGISGAQHVPMICDIMKVWTPASHVQDHSWSRAQRKALYLHWRAQDPHAQQLEQTLHVQLDQLSPDIDTRLQQVHDCFKQHSGMQYSLKKPKPIFEHDLTPFQTFQWHTELLRDLFQSKSLTLQTIFKAWHHMGRRQQARRMMNRTSKEARKQRLQHIYDAANRAEHAKDTFQFYQCIRELSPKLPYRRIQLRSKTGELLGPADAADELQTWFASLYHASDLTPQPNVCHWPFTADELQYGLSHLPAMKALDPAYAPAPFWKMTSATISPFLHEHFVHCCEQGALPSCWSHGTLTFLPKPGTKGHHASELRPITLLEPTGKAMLGVFSQHLLQQVAVPLGRRPQFAYLHCRGTQDAIDRVRAHCVQVRQLLHDNMYHIQQRASGTCRHFVVGGLLMSLDLQKAFDSVLRSRLVEALRWYQMDDNLISILLHFYQNSCFTFQHRGESRTFPTNCGIRQGCKSAPILWAVFSGHILDLATIHIDWTWIQHMLTGFADDFCIHQSIENIHDVHQAIQRCGQFLDILKDAGLTVNMKKTIAIFRLKGQGAAKLLKQYTKRTKEGTFLLIPCRHGVVMIKLVMQISYLGTILNYNSFETHTMQHRINAATKVNRQLTRWLHTNHLTKAQKLRLWYQCIFPCAVYGLRNIGLTIKTLTMLDRMMMTQLRRIFREPAHLNHLSHTDFLEQFRVPDPLHRLLHHFEQAQQRDTQRYTLIPTDDILWTNPTVDHDHLVQVIRAVLDQQRGQARWAEVESTDYTCPLCEKSYTTLSQLRRHQTVAHGHSTGLLRTYQAMDTVQGVPTCNRCHQPFTTWHQLKYHIQFVCVLTRQEDDDIEHRLRVQEFLHYVRGLCLAALGQQQELCAYFLNRCLLCGKYILTIKGMLQHWHEDHTRTYQTHGPWYDYLHRYLPTENPCSLCGMGSKREHKCIILRQYAMHLAHTGEPVPADAAPQITFKCDHCYKVYTTKHGLDQHMRNYHQALQDGTKLTNAQFEASCLIMQAVETGNVAEILFDDNVKSLLSRTCLACHKSFNRKQELLRHLRNHHADFWNRLTQEATALEQQWKKTGECYCDPIMHNRKHLCTFFLQFAMLRLTLGSAPDADMAREHPDQQLTSREVVTQLTWLGLLPLMLFKSHMKLTLSLHCIICAARFSCTMLLAGHLRQHHAAELREAHEWTKMVGWVLFGAHGCVCNPATHHGVAGHFCPLQLQVAHIIRTSGLKVAIPWTFRATDLMDLLETSVTTSALKKITHLIMSRQFELLIDCPEVFQLLTHRCIWCDEAVPIRQALAHLQVAHTFDVRNIKLIIDQLAVVAAQTHDGFWCSYCGELLPSTEIAFDIAPQPEKHLPLCPYITMLAVMLSYPMWHRRPFDPDVWPSPDEVERAYHSLHQRRVQFNVRHSEVPDTFGAAFEPLAECGLDMLSDPQLLTDIKYKCLICHKSFFLPWKAFSTCSLTQLSTAGHTILSTQTAPTLPSAMPIL